MKLIFFGGTGFIGSHIFIAGIFRDMEVYLITRHPAKAIQFKKFGAKLVESGTGLHDRLVELFSGEYAIINLAGAGISDRLWTQSRKKLIINSRLKVTNMISEIVNQASEKPDWIIQASAVGYYGFSREKIFTENDPSGNAFLSEVTRKWEDALRIDEKTNTRIVYLRTGVVLGKDGGFIKKNMISLKLFTGAWFGDGKQFVPWIHIDDVVRAIQFLQAHPTASGPFNLASPEPVRLKILMRTVGKTINRPVWVQIPSWFVILMSGSFGKELLLSSARVAPAKLLDEGFKFRFLQLEEAVTDLFRKNE